jgi:beta-glucanase (GH16 family)
MQLAKSLTLTIAVISLCVSSCKKKIAEEPETPAPTVWTEVFTEDFDTDLSQWNIWQGGAYNNEYQYYSNSSSNLSISGGILAITAIKETVTGATTNSNPTTKSFDFTSGRIESKTLYSAKSSTPKVKFSAMIKLPDGYGMWPAFWSYGANWPMNGEIDILEAKGNLPYQYSTNYFYGTVAGTDLVHNSDVSTYTSASSLTDSYHLYEVIWEQNSLTFLLDGVIVSTKTGTYIPSMFGKSQMITLDLAVGGDYFGNPLPSTIVTGTMYVDWVKAYTSL